MIIGNYITPPTLHRSLYVDNIKKYKDCFQIVFKKIINPDFPTLCIALQYLSPTFKTYIIPYGIIHEMYYTKCAEHNIKKSQNVSILNKIELHGDLRRTHDYNSELHCRRCIEQHNICPCAGVASATFPIRQRAIYSAVGNNSCCHLGILIQTQLLGWNDDELISLLRIVANLSISFWDSEALTMIDGQVYKPGRVDMRNPQVEFNGRQHVYLISYGI